MTGTREASVIGPFDDTPRDPVEILIVEDNPAHARLAKAALLANKVKNPIEIVTNGTDALKRIRSEPPFEGRPPPLLILLDLRLPDMHGLDILKAVKADTSTRSTAVVVLTSSREEADVQAAYRDYANAFVRKPMDFPKFVEALARLQDFWLTVNTFPPGGRQG